MPRTIEEGFVDFNENLKLLKSESEAIKKHRASIHSCLKNKFGMNRFFKTGSVGNGTNVNGFSDTDYFAGIPTENLKENSASTLTAIKEALQETFPSTKNIRVDSPAVVVPFGTVASEITEIIPADFLKTEDGVNIYDIPDGDGKWMNASPKAHNEYVSKVDKKHGNKVKPLIRFIKAWKYYQNVPISSFYLEMRIAKYADQESIILYSTDVYYIFKNLLDGELSSMIDPVGVSGYIEACASQAKKDDAISKLKTALTRAEKARAAEEKGEIKESFEWWNLLYNEKFPSYYR
ncbi:MAG: hypothetical protein ACD_9C00068G0003 [uncultured bacterium]|nr:MAG: hypothetical protein ACD_9C00068G0003 [uncultured bacterium]